MSRAEQLRQRAGADVAAHTDDLMNGPNEAAQRAFEKADCPWMMRDLNDE